ncbi:hypothetical protein [Bifidobacterium panos]|uniref:Transposase n=1 Tax=Bifidobacterium panos TaxID=2675321 RepID=A0ABX1SY53_9BIFI|nr:hypothetical protein [Bifidobacterium sp. DSM 109963]NMN02781.1 hypothetical protein [Bifidobacterium sp. DSM 109963]
MASIDKIDWLEYMRVNALDQPDLFVDRLPNEWIVNKCLMAAEIAKTACPVVERRMRYGYLSERGFANVVCSMVLRVCRWKQIKSESNGSYEYTNQDPLQNQPGYDASPNLYVSKRERNFLNGVTDDADGPMGTIGVAPQAGWNWSNGL